jgi:tRNA(fMet)-specific endonuclease VapC
VDVRRLLDTTAYVALRRGHPGVARAATEAEELIVSIVVVGELLFGFRNGTRFEANHEDLERFLAEPFVALVLVTRATADRYGRIAATLRRQGTPIPSNDIWIAAHVQETGAELVTLDEHFDRVPGLPVLRFDP